MLPFALKARDRAWLNDVIAQDRDQFRAALDTHAAIPVRDFRLTSTTEVREAVNALSGEAMAYEEANTPRSESRGNVYTSTEHPAEEIFVRNEYSYRDTWPMLLHFCCHAPLRTRWVTLRIDMRRQAAMNPPVRKESGTRRWSLVRKYHPNFSLPWRTVFGSDNRAAAEAYCTPRDLAFKWIGTDVLRTSMVRDALHRHPQIGDGMWFNDVAFDHVTTLPEDAREGLLALFVENGLPMGTYCGDGERIPDDVVNHLRECCLSARVRSDWHRGYLLVVANMLASHSCEPYHRSVVAMAEPCSLQQAGER